MMTILEKLPGPMASNRVKRRRGIRERIAEVLFSEKRADELSAEIAEHDRLCDQTADKHRTTTEPIQSRLKELETSILKSLADREPVHPGDESERADLLKQLAAANDVLARETEHRDKITAPLKTERDRLRVSVAGQIPVLENDLCSEKNAAPELLDEIFLTSQRVSSAQLRVNAVSPGLEFANAIIQRGKLDRNPEYQQMGETRLRRWKIEAAEAQRLLAEARAELEQIRRRMIDE